MLQPGRPVAKDEALDKMFAPGRPHHPKDDGPVVEIKF
jgi:hypothetical protein